MPCKTIAVVWSHEAAFGSWYSRPRGRRCLLDARVAQGAQIDGTPLNVFADGLGRDPDPPGRDRRRAVLRPGREPGPRGAGDQGGRELLPARVGLRRPPGPTNVAPPALDRRGRDQDAVAASTGSARTCRSPRPSRYTDGVPQVDIRYGIENVSARAGLAARRCARGPLRRRQRQRQRRDRRRAAALRRRPRGDHRPRVRPAGGHALARLPGGRLRGRLRQLRRRRAQQHGRLRGARQRRRRRVRASTTCSPASAAISTCAGCSPRRRRPARSRRRARRQRQPGRRRAADRAAAAAGRRARRSTSASARAASSSRSRRRRSSSSSRARCRSRSARRSTRRKGRVNLVSTTGTGGKTQLAWFYDGIFKVGQTARRQADHRPRARRGAREVPEGQGQGERRGQEEDAQALGRGQGRVPHLRQVQLGDRARHQVGRDRPLRRHAHAGHPGNGPRARLQAQAQQRSSGPGSSTWRAR